MRILGCLVLALAAAGCATPTLKDLVDAKGRGTSVVYRVPQEKAWEVASDLLWDVANEAPEGPKDLGFLFVKAGLGDDETLVAVWVDPADRPDWSRVTVVCRRVHPTQLGVALTEEQFQDLFRQAVGARKPRK